jgi:hypothetical protein
MGAVIGMIPSIIGGVSSIVGAATSGSKGKGKSDDKGGANNNDAEQLQKLQQRFAQCTTPHEIELLKGTIEDQLGDNADAKKVVEDAANKAQQALQGGAAAPQAQAPTAQAG